MTVSTAAATNQRPRPVVAVACEAGRSLCRALVQALSETAPALLYRINPTPFPPDAFDLQLDLSDAGLARLRWQENGAGAPVTRAGVSDIELARQLVAASPALATALQAVPHHRPAKK